MLGIREEVINLVGPLLEESGMELVDVEYRPEHGRNTLRLYIDKPGGITLDDCSNVSRELGTILDVKDIIPASYDLEVSSPGIDRPLTREKDFKNFAGKMVKVQTKDPVSGRRNFHARLGGLKDGRVLLTDSDGHGWEIKISNIKRARLDVSL